VDDLDEVTLALSGLVLDQLEPSEAQLLDAVGPELLQSVDAGPGRDGSLGFGGLEIIFAFVVIKISREVLRRVLDVLLEGASKVAGDQLGDVMKQLLAALKSKRRGVTPEATVALSGDEVGRVREVAFSSAVKLGLDETRARLLADAMGGALFFPDPGATA
jgi:hypothetical protein